MSVILALLARAATIDAATLHVGSGDSLQAALNAAQSGDVILLQSGATFTGNFVLPVKSGTEPITIQTALAPTVAPPTGQRISLALAPAFAKLRSGNNASALRTAAGTRHWRLRWIEFQANRDGYGDIIAIGNGSTAQRTLADVPHDIELDQVYVHGDPLVGQKRGIALNASAVTIRNSVITDCKAVGMDAQAIAGWNGPGPYVIDNNYLEGAAENVIFGGTDPAIPGLIATGITFTRNHVAKPVSWREPIIPAPTGISAAVVPGGAIAPGTVRYAIVARRRVGQANMGRSTAATIDVDVRTTAAVQLRWTSVPYAAEYEVFARGMMWRVTSPSFTDSGAAGSAASPPSGAGTRWLVKNLFELKNARQVTVQYNLFEGNWQDGQTGYAIVFTPRNSGHTCDWCAIDDVSFQFNIVRHSAAGINILGYDGPAVSGQASNIRIRHNLFADISKARWGGNGWFLLIGEEPRDIIVDHNTIDHDGTSAIYAYGGTAAAPRPIRGFQFTNNLVRHARYGINAASLSYGAAAIDAYFPDSLISHNLLSGGSADRYPQPNYFDTPFASAFTNLAAGDYTLNPSGIGAGRGSDGSDLGADIRMLRAALTGIEVDSASPAPSTTTLRPPANLRLSR